MSAMLRLVLLFILSVMSYQSLGKMMAIDVAIYNYDGSQNAFHVQNHKCLTYVPVNTNISSSKSLEENILDGYFFAFASDFDVPKGLAGNPMFKSALGQFKNTSFTNAGRALTKHPEVTGATKETLRQGLRTDEQLNKAAADALKNIMRNGVKSTSAHPRYGEIIRDEIPEGVNVIERGGRFFEVIEDVDPFLVAKIKVKEQAQRGTETLEDPREPGTSSVVTDTCDDPACEYQREKEKYVAGPTKRAGEVLSKTGDVAKAILVPDETDVAVAVAGGVVGVVLNKARKVEKVLDATDEARDATSTRKLAKNDVLNLAEKNITDSGQTVLGHYPGYVNKANTRGASYFDIGDTWKGLTDTERWAANRHFLDIVTSKGDNILLSTPKSKIATDSWLAREVEYLTREKGYVWINQWSLRPGG